MATTALAQEAPPPRKMPRTPVARETIAESHDTIPASKELQGSAIILDGEKLRIGKTDVRLFGVVPPQLTASFGPQARTALEGIIGGQNIYCKIRDRDRDGRLLATCTNVSGSDVALDLLKRGLAVTSRGSLTNTELAAPYLAAEQAAQSHKIGLWSIAVNAPVSVPLAAPGAPPKQESPPEAESKKEEKARAEQAAQAKAAAEAQAKAAALAQTQAQAKIAATIISEAAEAQKADLAWVPPELGFLERYQILISGLLMLATALSIAGSIERQRMNDRRDETKALAAALRGELMAARGVCFGRAKSITCEAEERTAAWPRIRTTLYQAYVGRLGFLGADLARQIAAVYGQSSDYASIYNPTTGGALVEVSKKHALEMLIKRIDEVLPKLGEVERTGKLSSSRIYTSSGAEAPSSASQSISAGFNVLSGSAVKLFSFFRTIHEVWGNARAAVLNSRSVLEPPPPLPPEPPIVSEYTAVIEADMERYQYAENVEALVTPTHRKRHKEKGAA